MANQRVMSPPTVKFRSKKGIYLGAQENTALMWVVEHVSPLSLYRV